MNDNKWFLGFVAVLMSSLIFISLILISGCVLNNDDGLGDNTSNEENSNDNNDSNSIGISNNISEVQNDDENDSSMSLVNIIRDSGKEKSNLPPPPRPGN